MDAAHKPRIALNEATYRNVNEAMRADGREHVITVVASAVASDATSSSGSAGPSTSAFEATRGGSRSCQVHDVPGVEDVVERYDGYADIREARRRRRRASSPRTRAGRER